MLPDGVVSIRESTAAGPEAMDQSPLATSGEDPGEQTGEHGHSPPFLRGARLSATEEIIILPLTGTPVVILSK
jgi:hypothetical protein